MHPLIAQTTATRWIAGAARRATSAWTRPGGGRGPPSHQPDLVFLTSPNNPTGSATPLEVIEAVCAAAPGMVVVDEAYAEFARDPAAPRWRCCRATRGWSWSAPCPRRSRWPGARVGYLAADPAVVDALLLVRLPYHLSAVTQAVALAALRHSAELLSIGRRDPRGARSSSSATCAGSAWRRPDSDANFVLFGRFADRHAVWQALLDRGVLVRETGPPDWLRVSIGTATETATFLSEDERACWRGGAVA